MKNCWNHHPVNLPRIYLPLPRMQSSPPGWLDDIFGSGISNETYPSFMTVTDPMGNKQHIPPKGPQLREVIYFWLPGRVTFLTKRVSCFSGDFGCQAMHWCRDWYRHRSSCTTLKRGQFFQKARSSETFFFNPHLKFQSMFLHLWVLVLVQTRGKISKLQLRRTRKVSYV